MIPCSSQKCYTLVSVSPGNLTDIFMLRPLFLVFLLLVELMLLIVIFLFLLLGVLGIFLPVIPGIVLIGVGAAIYSLMINKNFGLVTPRVHRGVLISKNKVLSLSIIKKSMVFFKKFSQRKSVKDQELVVKHGAILLSFNFLLALAFILSISGLTFLIGLVNSPATTAAFVPLLLIFIFAAVSAVTWYRFGQILGTQFKGHKVTNASLVVLISILPLLMLLFILSSIVNVVGGFHQEALAVIFMSLVFMATLASVFELIIVSLGALTSRR